MTQDNDAQAGHTRLLGRSLPRGNVWGWPLGEATAGGGSTADQIIMNEKSFQPCQHNTYSLVMSNVFPIQSKNTHQEKMYLASITYTHPAQ